jgi:hypothetical protein
MRRFDLGAHIVKDVSDILSSGKRTILRCLLRTHYILSHSDAFYLMVYSRTISKIRLYEDVINCFSYLFWRRTSSILMIIASGFSSLLELPFCSLRKRIRFLYTTIQRTFSSLQHLLKPASVNRFVFHRYAKAMEEILRDKNQLGWNLTEIEKCISKGEQGTGTGTIFFLPDIVRNRSLSLL